MAPPVIEFQHDNTPVKIPFAKLRDKIQKVLGNAFNPATGEPKIPLDSTI